MMLGRTWRWIAGGGTRDEAFTLLELLIVIAVIAILTGFVLPALIVARRTAQSSNCQNNLKQIGTGLMQYGQDYAFLCSGAYDWRRDGDVRKIGWVADLVNQGYGAADKLKCGSNTGRFSEKWNDICDLSSITTTYGEGELPASQVPDRISLAQCQEAYRAGYNSNYAASWYLVRTAMRGGLVPSTFMPDRLGVWEQAVGPVTPEGRDSLEGVPNVGRHPLSLRNTVGPLQLSMLGSTAGYTTDKIPLLGDANLGAYGVARLAFSGLGKDASAQDIGVESYTAGPVVFPDGFCGPGNKVGQDYFAFLPIHGRGNKKWANMLFADSHVATMPDLNVDNVIGYTGDSASPGEERELEEVAYGSLVKHRTP